MRNLSKRYNSFLKFYPEPYRQKYASQMKQTFQDMLADTNTEAEQQAVFRRAVLNLPVSITQAQFNYLGGIMRTETPHFVKRTGLIETLLIGPFFLALLINIVNQSVYGRDLNSSWLWSKPVLITWVFVLPVIALLLAVVSYIRLTTKINQTNSLKKVLNLRNTWPVMIPGFLAIGILLFLVFHDSVHCLISNPVVTAHNPHQTLQCISDGLLGGK